MIFILFNNLAMWQQSLSVDNVKWLELYNFAQLEHISGWFIEDYDLFMVSFIVKLFLAKFNLSGANKLSMSKLESQSKITDK